MDTLKRLTRQSGFYQSDTDLLADALAELIEKKLKPGPKGDKGDPGTCTCPKALPMTTTQPSAMTTQPPTGPSERCGGPGWRKVAFIDMTNTSQNCPQGLTLTGYSKRSCGRKHTNVRDCSSVITFPVGGGQELRLISGGTCFPLLGITATRSGGINAQYVDGLSFTHGTHRTHIWTFAAGLYQGTSGDSLPRCPCNQGNTIGSPPFVGNDYFCESGVSSRSATRYRIFFPDDPLWDGQGCIHDNTCCLLNKPPWFKKTLPTPTTDDIEMRLCMWSSATYSNIALEQMELYVY